MALRSAAKSLSARLAIEFAKKPSSHLNLGTCHLSATLGAFFTCLDAFVHAADLLAILCASLADFGAKFAKPMLKMGTAELEIGRCLAYFGTVHDESEVFWFDVFSTSL